MAAEALTQAVRHRPGPGRLLPLGDAPDCAWLAEQAAAEALRVAAAAAVPSVRLDSLRFAPDSPGDTNGAVVPAPPEALPHGPLRIDADFAAGSGVPLPSLADRLRDALLAASERQLGLRVRSADLRAASLLDEPYDARAHTVRPHAEAEGHERAGREETAGVARAVLAVPGVTRLAPVLGAPYASSATGVSEDAPDEEGGRRLLVQCAVAPSRRVLDVVRAVQEAAARTGGVPETPGRETTVTVLVTAVDRGPETGRGGDTGTVPGADGTVRRTQG